ncbi:MAG: DUF72 domain-containing protein, partial [Candidatus Aminicenantes bacterium]|nr:DUF72 domain-containing protein [Candidatus Aminicenantes bacterium]
MATLEGIALGPAGWSYSDWRGTVYPEPLPARFNPLAYLAAEFDFVEVNTSFYRIPSPALTRGWVDKTAAYPEFNFWLKLHQSFTHEGKLEKTMIEGFHACLEPLAEAGRLAGVLAQFPYSFKFTPSNLAY